MDSVNAAASTSTVSAGTPNSTCAHAYNLVRTVIAQSAAAPGCTPRQMSFTGALQAMKSFAERLQDAGLTPAITAELHDGLLRAVGNGPDRSEPRAIKRRPKPHPLLDSAACRRSKAAGVK